MRGSLRSSGVPLGPIYGRLRRWRRGCGGGDPADPAAGLNGGGGRLGTGRQRRSGARGSEPSRRGRPGWAALGRREGRGCRARGEGERRGRREEKRKKKIEKKKMGERKRKRGERERKERDGAGFAAPTAAGRARAPVARGVRDEGLKGDGTAGDLDIRLGSTG